MVQGGVLRPNPKRWFGGYWPYSIRSNLITTNDANFGLFLSDLSTIREVGNYSNRSSFYGTFDQTGNLEEVVSEDSLVDYDDAQILSREAH